MNIFYHHAHPLPIRAPSAAISPAVTASAARAHTAAISLTAAGHIAKSKSTARRELRYLLRGENFSCFKLAGHAFFIELQLKAGDFFLQRSDFSGIRGRLQKQAL